MASGISLTKPSGLRLWFETWIGFRARTCFAGSQGLETERLLPAPQIDSPLVVIALFEIGSLAVRRRRPGSTSMQVPSFANAALRVAGAHIKRVSSQKLG